MDDLQALPGFLTTWLADWLANPSPRLLILIPVLAFLEAAPVIGIFVSGVFLLSTATLLYASGTVAIAPIVLLAFAGAMTGDTSGYLAGRLFGPAIWQLPFIERYDQHAKRARSLMSRSAPWAICVGRLTPAIRSVTPVMAGMVVMPARRFIACDLLACSIWAGGLYLLVSGIARFSALGKL